MQTYILKRILLMLVTLWGITFVSFVMLQLTPGSPLEMKLMQDKNGGLGDKSALTPETRALLEAQYHLDKPILVRYVLWLKDIARLDFGESFADHRPVIEKIYERLPVSLIFGLTSIVVSLLIGLPLGLLSGAFQNSFIDRFTAIAVVAMYSMPVYVIGILLLTFFGGGDFFNWFPIYGIQSDDYANLSMMGKILDRVHHFILPCICYSIGSLAFITQQQRASILEALHQDYIRTARAKGLPELSVFIKHAFRNSLIPIITIIGALIPSILGGAVIIETMFSIPGLGLLAWESLLQRDYPTIMANFTISAFLSLLGIFVSDLLYMIVDPRIDFEGR
ncbi:MAG: ABC transporter permease [Deltaproteobacteria bacterium]|nr:ABC transporter permease [Deltaproteobacteria bacterium]